MWGAAACTMAARGPSASLARGLLVTRPLSHTLLLRGQGEGACTREQLLPPTRALIDLARPDAFPRPLAVGPDRRASRRSTALAIRSPSRTRSGVPLTEAPALSGRNSPRSLIPASPCSISVRAFQAVAPPCRALPPRPWRPTSSAMVFPRAAKVADSSSLAPVASNASHQHPLPPRCRGALIVFEGLDRSGKSTQCSRLAEKLRQQGVPVESLRFPDRSTPIGQEIAQYLASTKEVDMATIHRLFSQNRWEKKEQMEKLLLSGTTLIVDRYAFSGVAYSAAKGLDLQWCKESDAGLPAPDLVVFLNVSPEAAALRGDYGNERYEKLGFQQLVAEQYSKLRDDTWKEVDASEGFDEVFARVEGVVREVVEKCKGPGAPHIGQLWESLKG